MSFVLSLIVFAAGFSIHANEFKIPPLTSHVQDTAQVLSPALERELTRILEETKTRWGVEMVVLSLRDLGGVPIEQASIQILDKWKLGTAEADKGLLLLLAMKERKLRIEVGQGLEGELTDLDSRRIIDHTMVPLLKAGDVEKAVFLGSFQMLKTALPEAPIETLFESTGRRNPYGQPSSKSSPLRKIVTAIIILLLFLLGGRGGWLPLVLLGGMGGRSGNRYGAGGFGGGGFGGGGLGGGGGFSGGGASGGW